jgi:hypothetical protein
MAVAQVFEKASPGVVKRRAALAATGALTLSDALPQTFEPIAVPEPLAPLFPEGLRRGETLALPGDAPTSSYVPATDRAPASSSMPVSGSAPATARPARSAPASGSMPAADRVPVSGSAPATARPARSAPASMPTAAVHGNAFRSGRAVVPADGGAPTPDPIPLRAAASVPAPLIPPSAPAPLTPPSVPALPIPASAPFGSAAVDYLTLALLAGALRQGLWCAAVGVRGLGGAALAELLGAEALGEGALQRLLVVAEPGERWAEIATVLADGVDVVLLSPPDVVSAQVARRVDARLRQGAGDESRHRAALLVLGAWPSARTTLRVRRLAWTGFDAGTGHLVAGHAQIEAEDRTRRRRDIQVLLPEDLGAGSPLSPLARTNRVAGMPLPALARTADQDRVDQGALARTADRDRVDRGAGSQVSALAWATDWDRADQGALARTDNWDRADRGALARTADRDRVDQGASSPLSALARTADWDRVDRGALARTADQDRADRGAGSPLSALARTADRDRVDRGAGLPVSDLGGADRGHRADGEEPAAPGFTAVA